MSVAASVEENSAADMSPKGFTIREARLDDYASIAALTVRSFETGAGHTELTRVARRPAEADVAGRVAAGTVLVAVSSSAAGADAAIIGTASVLRAGTGPSRLARGDEAELRFVAVASAWRRSGVGDELLGAGLEIAYQSGARAAVLDVSPRNSQGRRLAERIGFSRVEGRDSTEPVDGTDATAVVGLTYRYDLTQLEGVRIRLIRRDEIAEVGDLTERAYRSDYEVTPSYAADLRDVESRAVRDEVWVAEDIASGALLGSVWTPRPGERISQLARPGELDFRMLAVAPEARGRGIGQALAGHVIALGRDRGAVRVVMNSGPEMAGAHRLYERLGFVHLPEREGPKEVAPGVVVHLYAYGYDLKASPAVEI